MRDKTLNTSRIVISIHHLPYIVYVSRLWGHPIRSGGHASLCLRNKEKGIIENGSHISYLNSIPYVTHYPPFFPPVTEFFKDNTISVLKSLLRENEQFSKITLQFLSYIFERSLRKKKFLSLLYMTALELFEGGKYVPSQQFQKSLKCACSLIIPYT